MQCCSIRETEISEIQNPIVFSFRVKDMEKLCCIVLVKEHCFFNINEVGARLAGKK